MEGIGRGSKKGRRQSHNRERGKYTRRVYITAGNKERHEKKWHRQREYWANNLAYQRKQEERRKRLNRGLNNGNTSNA